MDCLKRYIVLMNDYPAAYIPKVHLSMHLIYRTTRQGAGNLYSNWLDESLNKILKRACRGASQQTFEVTVLRRMSWNLRQLSARSAGSALGGSDAQHF